jgi:mannose-6-phosphate isomerase-like protein (cupin superfamily)
MQRRTFLKTVAILPIAGLDTFALAQLNAPAREVHVVPAAQDRFGEQHSLGFSTILFKTMPTETGGNLFIIEHKNLGHGGPPLHLHLHQEEWFYVMEGEVLFQVGDTRQTLRSGESVLAPRAIPHTFTGTGPTPAHMLIAFTPAGKMEDFFRATAIPNGPKVDAALFARYDMQYVGPPLAV